jgi:hypothetical protein
MPRVLPSRLVTLRSERNLGGYERAGVASDADAAEMRKLAIAVRDHVRAWLEASHPELIAEG